MAFTSADLVAIDRAIASGELSVSVGERRVTYRSMEELLAAKATIAGELAAATVSGTRAYPRYQTAEFCDE